MKNQKTISLLNDLRNNPKLNLDNKGYFKTLEENIYGKMKMQYFEMFSNGAGKELDEKARAVHSSAMLAYNFFSWINKDNEFIYNNIHYNDVQFEKKLNTIKGSSAPANIDIVLTSKDSKHMLFIESKFTEYLHNQKFNISDKYNNSSNNYANIDWSKLIKLYKDKTGEYYQGVKQNICHLVALNNYANNINKQNINCDIKFINLVFDPSKTYKEYDNYDNYNKLMRDFYDNYEKRVSGILVKDVELVSYSKLWKQMKKCIKDNKLIEFLEDRYIKYTK